MANWNRNNNWQFLIWSTELSLYLKATNRSVDIQLYLFFYIKIMFWFSFKLFFCIKFSDKRRISINQTRVFFCVAVLFMCDTHRFIYNWWLEIRIHFTFLSFVLFLPSYAWSWLNIMKVKRGISLFYYKKSVVWQYSNITLSDILWHFLYCRPNKFHSCTFFPSKIQSLTNEFTLKIQKKTDQVSHITKKMIHFYCFTFVGSKLN